MLSIDEARHAVLAATRRLDLETVSIPVALGRTLAQAIEARHDTPPFPNSAMDGYAVLAGPAGRELVVVGESRAGAPTDQALTPGRPSASPPAPSYPTAPRRSSARRM